jgi:hypothetical protein
VFFAVLPLPMVAWIMSGVLVTCVTYGSKRVPPSGRCDLCNLRYDSTAELDGVTWWP